MPSMKCISCGISFFSPAGASKCSRCAGKDAQMSDHSCGCGHHH